MIANARMYGVAPGAVAAWRTLLEWVVRRAGIDCEVFDFPPPRPLPELWARADLACAFMCGFPLSRAAVPPQVLAAPVPSPASYGGRPLYWTELVVAADAPIADAAAMLGRRMAYTTPESQSGYQAVRRFFAPYAARSAAPLFAAMIGPLVTPRAVVEAVARGEADVGPVDSYALDLLRRHEPGLVARIRTVAATPPTPIPPLIASPHMAAEDRVRVVAALTAVGHAPELDPVRRDLVLLRFEPIDQAAYAGLAADAAATDRLGYPVLV
ncbi:MAG: PhnD/SsuA/transferrin family substrate-binding protein [Casimicrobiaceae bacterium]